MELEAATAVRLDEPVERWKAPCLGRPAVERLAEQRRRGAHVGREDRGLGSRLFAGRHRRPEHPLDGRLGPDVKPTPGADHRRRVVPGMQGRADACGRDRPLDRGVGRTEAAVDTQEAALEAEQARLVDQVEKIQRLDRRVAFHEIDQADVVARLRRFVDHRHVLPVEIELRVDLGRVDPHLRPALVDAEADVGRAGRERSAALLEERLRRAVEGVPPGLLEAVEVGRARLRPLVRLGNR